MVEYSLLQNFGVQICNPDGSYVSYSNILSQLSLKWDLLMPYQQEFIANHMVGNREKRYYIENMNTYTFNKNRRIMK